VPHRYGNSHAIWDHTVLPATRQRWHSRPYPSRSWYSIKRPLNDARLSRPSKSHKMMLTGSHWQAVWRMPSPGRRTHARTYGRTTRKHNAFGPVSCVGRGINMRRTKARALATNCILRPQPRQCPTRMDGSCEERRRKHARYYRSPGRPTRAICSRDFTVSVSRAKHWGPVNVTLFIPTECSRDSRRHFSYSEWGDDLDVVHPVRTTYGTDGDEIWRK